MRACPACPGFVPDHCTSCPHCGAGGSRWSRLARALAGLAGGAAAAVTLAACYGAPPYIDTCPDSDRDGWFPGCYNDDLSCDEDDPNCDCDDGDPYVNPGATDPLGDGLDRDCDGKDGQRPGGPYPDAWSTEDAEPDAWVPPDAATPDAEVPPDAWEADASLEDAASPE